MTAVGDAFRMLRTILMIQEDVRALKTAVASQSERLAAMAQSQNDLRDRVARLEGFIEGATAAARLSRIEG